MNTWKIVSVATALLYGAVGCGGEDPISTVDAGPMLLDPMEAFDLDGNPVALDLSCQGTWTAPATDGAAANFIGETSDYQSGDLLPNVPFNFYPSNDVPAALTCAGDCVAATSDGASHVNLMGNTGAWFAYYFAGGTDCTSPETCPVVTAQYDVPVPADGATQKIRAVSLATLNLIPSVLGVTRQGGTGLIAGTFFDCNDHPIMNMQARAYRPDGTFIEAPVGAHTQPAYRYFNGEQQPDATAKFSQEDGLFGALNLPVPAGGEPIRIEGWGNVGGEMHMVSCEEIRIFADGVAIFNLRPDRADGPSNCSE